MVPARSARAVPWQRRRQWQSIRYVTSQRLLINDECAELEQISFLLFVPLTTSNLRHHKLSYELLWMRPVATVAAGELGEMCRFKQSRPVARNPGFL